MGRSRTRPPAQGGGAMPGLAAYVSHDSSGRLSDATLSMDRERRCGRSRRNRGRTSGAGAERGGGGGPGRRRPGAPRRGQAPSGASRGAEHAPPGEAHAVQPDRNRPAGLRGREGLVASRRQRASRPGSGPSGRLGRRSSARHRRPRSSKRSGGNRRLWSLAGWSRWPQRAPRRCRHDLLTSESGWRRRVRLPVVDADVEGTLGGHALHELGRCVECEQPAAVRLHAICG